MELDNARKRSLIGSLKADIESLILRAHCSDAAIRRQKPEPHDSNLDALRAIFSGGGKYTQEVKEMEERLAKAKGRQPFTAEEQEQIRNAYHYAADLDQSKGRRG